MVLSLVRCMHDSIHRLRSSFIDNCGVLNMPIPIEFQNVNVSNVIFTSLTANVGNCAESAISD